MGKVLRPIAWRKRAAVSAPSRRLPAFPGCATCVSITQIAPDKLRRLCTHGAQCVRFVAEVRA